MTDSLNEQHQRLEKFTTQSVPFNTTLGLEVVSFEHNTAVARLPFRKEFIGDVEAGLWHTSVAVSLIDATGGMSVHLALDRFEPIATLDLRTDYLRPAVAGKPLIARAECYHVTRYIAFVRGELYQDSRDRLTAHCTATFMRTARRRSQ